MLTQLLLPMLYDESRPLLSWTTIMWLSSDERRVGVVLTSTVSMVGPLQLHARGRRQALFWWRGVNRVGL